MIRSIDHLGRNFALLVIIAGICLLGAVFGVAYQMFTHPVPGLQAALATHAAYGSHPEKAPSWPAAAGVIVEFVLKLALLFIMCFAGSVIAARGIHFYSAAITASQSPTPVMPPTAVRSSVSASGSADQ